MMTGKMKLLITESENFSENAILELKKHFEVEVANLFSEEELVEKIQTVDVLFIRLDENLELITIKIYSNLGQLIKSEESTTISTSDLSSGNYFIEITTDKGKATQSFIKQ